MPTEAYNAHREAPAQLIEILQYDAQSSTRQNYWPCQARQAGDGTFKPPGVQCCCGSRRSGCTERADSPNVLSDSHSCE